MAEDILKLLSRPDSPITSFFLFPSNGTQFQGNPFNRGAQSTSSKPGGTDAAPGTQERNSTVHRQPSHPSDDSDGDRDGKKHGQWENFAIFD